MAMTDRRFPLHALLVGVAVAVGCSAAPEQAPVAASTPGLTAFIGARIIDGTGGPVIERGVLVVRDGKIDAVGAEGAVTAPPDAERVDVAGKTIIPGLINVHGHVNDVRGLKADPTFYTEDHVRDQLQLYARYGVTTVFSLGGDGEAGVRVRDRQEAPGFDHARLFVAGRVVTGNTPEEAAQQVAQVVDSRSDWVKIRVDDNLGTTSKMAEPVFRAVIEESHQRGKRLAAHMFYLDDAKALLRAGADLLAHSVRDQDVDDELIALLKERNVCYSPTLMREVSTFVYETRPDFFDDPFFVRHADAAVLKALEEPAYQQRMRESKSAQQYKIALEMAKRNLKKLSDAGVRIAMGTDTGPAARFQGYFEHLELELTVDAGLTPMQALVSATGDAARCMQVDADLGTLQAGKWADFVVLASNPLDDIKNTRTLEAVRVAGHPLAEGN
jgi:imidazolonepropionase-like amidohydrolase